MNKCMYVLPTHHNYIPFSLLRHQEALDLPPPILATEYYTNQEMEGFKKTTKKTRKIRKKPKILKADDLLPLAGNAAESSDFRHRGSQET